MTFEELKKVNGELTAMDIKGKSYVPVNERVKGFRMLFPDGSIETELVKYEDGIVIMKATALDGNGRVISTGYAKEVEGSSSINRVSCIENTESSAVGRALGFLGLGIHESIASYEEVSNAKLNEEGNKLATPTEKAGLIATIRSKCTKDGMTPEEINLEVEHMTKEILTFVGYNRDTQPEGMTAKQYGKAMNLLNGGI